MYPDPWVRLADASRPAAGNCAQRWNPVQREWPHLPAPPVRLVSQLQLDLPGHLPLPPTR